MTRQRSICTSCGSTFWRDPAESWKHLCLDCWRESKAKADRQADNLRIQLNRALVENAVLQRKMALLETSTGIQPDMLRRLIQLAHPDMPGVRQKLFEMARGNPSRMARIQAEFGSGRE